LRATLLVQWRWVWSSWEAQVWHFDNNILYSKMMPFLLNKLI